MRNFQGFAMPRGTTSRFLVCVDHYLVFKLMCKNGWDLSVHSAFMPMFITEDILVC